MPGAHSRFAPSAAHRWMRCAASLLGDGGEEDESEYAKWGTACHTIAARILLTGIIPAVPEQLDSDEAEQIVAARTYALKVLEYADGAAVMVEQRLDFNHLLPEGTEGQEGTTDACVVKAFEGELQAHDLKGGMGVKVYASENEQLRLYALSALNRFEMAADIKQVRLVIHQPRLDHVDEELLTVEELKNFGEAVRERIEYIENLFAADLVNDEVPGEKQCRWCKRKTVCTAYAQMVFDTIAGEFVDLTDPDNIATVALDAMTEGVVDMGDNRLAVAMAAVPMIEQWCLAVRAKVEANLLANKNVPGFKLVRGRKGNREWIDEAKAEKQMRKAKLSEAHMFKPRKLQSPPGIEKLVKAGVLSDSQWKTLSDNITQSDGALSVAPSTDKRPPVSVTADASEFSDETGK